jgi:hypothetical protein
MRSDELGATRVCPHCKTTVLASSAICPACNHHLRFNIKGKDAAAPNSYQALQVDGTFRHSSGNGSAEYSIVLTVEDERGTRVIRQIVNVGALRPAESRTLRVSVEVMPAGK